MYTRFLSLGKSRLSPMLRSRFHTCSKRAEATNFLMPALSPTMTEGGIATWLKKEGESFSAGDLILQIETDKAQMDVEAQDDGIMEGAQNIAVGTPIAILAEEGDDISNLEIPDATPPQANGDKPVEAAKEEAKETSSSPSTASSGAQGKGNSGKFSPAAEYAIHANKISNASEIPATGPKGYVLKGDVIAFIKAGKAETKKQETQEAPKAAAKIEAAPKPKETPKSAQAAPYGGADYLVQALESSVLRQLAKQDLEKKGITATIIANGIQDLKKKLGSQLNILALASKAAAIAHSLQPLFDKSSTIGIATTGGKGSLRTIPADQISQMGVEELAKAISSKATSADAGEPGVIISSSEVYQSAGDLPKASVLLIGSVYQKVEKASAESILDGALDELIGGPSAQPKQEVKQSAVLDLTLISSSPQAGKFLSKVKSLLENPSTIGL
ncbi:pyridoxine biosynthesis protein [Mycoemilia scoparia]|uniref:Pyridoxine biosynthesis protein n=1 Tax=Mycoemilia scoparia TaxID=417184 RepID=A0A9W8DLD4_9FUNG|nr:pyridoxine biosynthesis protein [Mycoemilia scoparia]